MAQGVGAAGRVLAGGLPPAGRPVAGVWVVLHETLRAGGGPLDSSRTDARGRFTFHVARPNPEAFYQVSTTHLGIAYFSEPLRAAGAPELRFAPLLVYDTSSAGPPVRLARRLVTVAKPGSDGTRSVLEILQLANPGAAIRITDDTVRPVWAGALPAVALQFQAGEADVSPEAILRRGDSVAVFAPIPPVVLKQVTYSYMVPGRTRTLTIPIDQWTGQVNLLLEDTTATVQGAPLDTVGVQDIEQRRFAAYATDSLPAGTALVIALPRAGFSAEAVVPYVVAFVALALVVGLVVALRRAPHLAPPPGTR